MDEPLLPPEVYLVADEARNQYLRDVDANDQISALTAAIDAAYLRMKELGIAQ